MNSAASATTSSCEMEDITDQVEHSPGTEDRLYRIDGVVVKIKTKLDPGLTTFGRETLRLTASICDETGRAHVVGARGAGDPVHFVLGDGGHLHTFCAVMGPEDLEPVDVHEEVERVRRRYVRHVLLALRQRSALARAPGVGSTSQDHSLTRSLR